MNFIFKGFLVNCEIYNGLHIEFILLYLILYYRDRVDWLFGIYQNLAFPNEKFTQANFEEFFSSLNNSDKIKEIFLSICDSNG